MRNLKRLKVGVDTVFPSPGKLKKLLADQTLDAAALRELLSKKVVGPPPSAKVSRICRPHWASQNGGPAQSSMPIAR
jgi:hypothetical protein